jgi:hypothetical protein
VRSLKAVQLDYSTKDRHSKLSSFHDIVLSNQFDVIALTETWLNSSITDFEVTPNGYHVIRKDRPSDKRGGGVMLAVKDTISTEPFNFRSDDLEMSSVIIKSISKRLLVAVCYRPPNAGDDFFQNLTNFLMAATKANLKDIILLGDFNFPHIEWLNGSGFSETSGESRFTEVLQGYGFFQIVNAPTRGSNLLDLVLTTNEYMIDNVEVTDDEAVSIYSDHNAITFDVTLNIQQKTSPRRKTYSKGDFEGLRESLRLLPLTDIVEGENDIDVAWSKWKDTFLAAVDTHIPSKLTSRTFTPPYFTSEIVHLLHRKETMRKRAKKTNSAEHWKKFRDLRRSTKRLIKTKKREYIKSLADTLTSNPKKFWKFFKSKTNKSSLPDTMTLNDATFTTSTAKADALNQFFASVFLPRSDNPIPTLYSNATPSSPEFSKVSVEEIHRLLCNLSTVKATGPDGISARLLKECADVLAPSLAVLLNTSLTLGKIPSEWKQANIVPIPKNNETRVVSNYRPISLLSLVSKVLEYVVHNQLLPIVEPFLNNQQHGFRRGRSCITQLLDVTHRIDKALDCGKKNGHDLS